MQRNVSAQVCGSVQIPNSQELCLKPKKEHQNTIRNKKLRDNYLVETTESRRSRNTVLAALGKGVIAKGDDFRELFDPIVRVATVGVAYEKIRLFSAAGLTDSVLRNVPYDTPTPIQQNAIPYIMHGSDLMGHSQTGSGKTAAYLLPLISSIIERAEETRCTNAPIGIIVAPTRELAVQIYEEGKKFAEGTGVRVQVVYGGTIVKNQRKDVRAGCHILVATPGRLRHFIREGSISLYFCRFLVLDEADQILKDGNFRKTVMELVGHCDMMDQSMRQTLMFSATFPKKIQKVGHRLMKDNFALVTVGKIGGAARQINQEFIEVQEADKKLALLDLLETDFESFGGKYQETFTKKTLVFVEMKISVDSLRVWLTNQDVPNCTMMHGERCQEEREESLADFKDGVCPVMVATAVAGRGLDIVGVDHVVNYDMPTSVDEYVQHIGRTGRVGNRGRATSFFQKGKDDGLAVDLIKILTDAQQKIPPFLRAIAGGVLKHAKDDFD